MSGNKLMSLMLRLVVGVWVDLEECDQEEIMCSFFVLRFVKSS